MEEQVEPDLDWQGLTVVCHHCGGNFHLEANAVTRNLQKNPQKRIRSLHGSIGVTCPACGTRLIVRYHRHWTATAGNIVLSH